MHDRLKARILELNKQGFGALNSSDTTATLIKEKQPKHWLHLGAVVITGGLWLFPYVYIIGKSRVKIHLEVEAAGLLRERREGGGMKAVLITYGALLGAYVVLGILAGAALPWLSWGNSVLRNSIEPSAVEQACSAMAAADFIMDEIENDIYSSKSISQPRIDALTPTEASIRSFIPSVEGDFQAYMATQADNVALAKVKLKAGVDAYMKVFNTDHLKFCRD